MKPPERVRAARVRTVGRRAGPALARPDVRFGYFIYPLGLLGWLALTKTTAPGPQGPETLMQDIVQDR